MTPSDKSSQAKPLALIANPSPDVYGADLQMLRTVEALIGDGWRVAVALPQPGPLVPRIEQLAAEVVYVDYPVLRKADLSPRRAVRLLVGSVAATVRLRKLIASRKPDLVLVNTVTMPWWILAARLTGIPVLCHLHEAEVGVSRPVRIALLSPLLLTSVIIVISKVTLNTMIEAIPRLGRRSRLIYNGVSQRPTPPKPPESVDPVGARLLVVGRLSPRKAPDLVLEAAAKLRERGYDVQVEVAGTPFAGYEWYEARLRERAARPDLRGHVDFTGYTFPIWPALERASVVVQPTRFEPFGLAVVEAQYALRPVVATGAMGHLETIEDGRTGLLSKPDDADSIADCVAALIDDPVAAAEMAARARKSAMERFSVDRYAREIATLARDVASGWPRQESAAG